MGVTYEQLPTPSEDPEKTFAAAATPKKPCWTRKRVIAGAAGLLLVRLIGGLPVHNKHFKGRSEHYDRGDGYLEGLIADGFALEDAYTLNPELVSPHPSVARLASTNVAADVKHGHGKAPHHWISPKVAEGLYLQVPEESSCMNASRLYTAEEHRAGSGNDHLTALRIKEEWETFFGVPRTGPYENVFDAGSTESQNMVRGHHDKPVVWVDTYYPVMNKPVSSEVSILKPGTRDVEWSAALREDILEEDPFSILRDEVPVFHGLSSSGNVVGQVVFAGYGRKTDFALLAAKGISVEGKIALVKYGGVFRGLKVKAAEEAGALGCIIYSDPGDDGEMTEKNGHLPYPQGPARNPSSVQRGSVQYLSSYPGDPTTPGTPAYPNATRVEGGNFPRIPSLPMSYRDALHLLAEISGQGIPARDVSSDWEGGLDIDYFTGPSQKEIRLINDVDTKIMPIWNTMARIPGHISEETVLIGNHRDAWVLGASDPSSGTAVVHEISKGLGELMVKGWKPLRNIILVSWDAEEYGLIGSTEWVEDFADWIPTNVVSYLNLDSTGAGSKFGASASPSLALLMKSTSEEINHPKDVTKSAWSARNDGKEWASPSVQSIAESSDAFEELFSSGTGVPSLGSGSDFTPFLQHLGIASCDGPGFGSASDEPVYHYHSIYDNEFWMEKFGDPGFHRHVTAARILGLVLLRLSDSLVLPLNITQYAAELGDYRDKVAHIYSELNFEQALDLEALSNSIAAVQKATASLDVKRDELLLKLKELIKPKPKKECSSKIRAVVHRFRHGKKGHDGSHRPSPKKLRKIKKVLLELKAINLKLARFEQGFISDTGLPGREWYKHLIVAPGRWLGYGTTTFPGLTEALTLDANVGQAQIEAARITVLLNELARSLSK